MHNKCAFILWVSQGRNPILESAPCNIMRLYRKDIIPYFACIFIWRKLLINYVSTLCSTFTFYRMKVFFVKKSNANYSDNFLSYNVLKNETLFVSFLFLKVRLNEKPLIYLFRKKTMGKIRRKKLSLSLILNYF